LKKKILVSGSTGQVGQELQFISNQHPEYIFEFKNRSQLDLSHSESIKNSLLNSDYDCFINAAAYTAVDKAETEIDLANAVNAEALQSISAFAPNNCKIIHISTDYVYNHNPGRPLEETDQTLAQNIYAKSKLKGESYLRQRQNAITIRTSWVYSSFGNNFVKTMLRLGKDRDNLSIVADQIGTPTYARDLATAIIEIIKFDQDNSTSFSGVFNYSNMGQTNWADFARKIFELEGISCQVQNTTTEAYNAPAARPLWSVLSKEKIKKKFSIEIPEWNLSLAKCLSEINKGL